MELVTVVPRQRLESIELLSGSTPKLRPPHRADLPLWLAILLKKQRRANIVPPAWLHPDSLREIVTYETAIDVKDWAPPLRRPSEPTVEAIREESILQIPISFCRLRFCRPARLQRQQEPCRTIGSNSPR
ncbi:DNA replication protein psf2 [Trichoderma virens]|nr:DNA replication protein psf2 [Trichoderma virens]